MGCNIEGGSGGSELESVHQIEIDMHLRKALLLFQRMTSIFMINFGGSHYAYFFMINSMLLQPKIREPGFCLLKPG